jgi:hypothetical protein
LLAVCFTSDQQILPKTDLGQKLLFPLKPKVPRTFFPLFCKEAIPLNVSAFWPFQDHPAIHNNSSSNVFLPIIKIHFLNQLSSKLEC